jgi:ATP-dependent 26S proteasome regulatory subunit
MLLVSISKILSIEKQLGPLFQCVQVQAVLIQLSQCVQVHAVVGVLSDDTDPMVTVMKLEKAPQETYADIGGEAGVLAVRLGCWW